MTNILITKNVLNNQQKETANARDLHSFLESKQDFSTWIKNRLQGFEENIDFVSFHKIVERETGATTKIDYYITIETAKHLAMLERNDVVLADIIDGLGKMQQMSFEKNKNMFFYLKNLTDLKLCFIF
jgi:phage anti-repressor protein